LLRPGPGLKKGSLDEEPMQTDVGTGPYVPGPGENPLYTAEPLTLEDLNLLSELFYLPYEYGPTAKTMLQELDWLKNNSGAAVADTEQVHLGSTHEMLLRSPLLPSDGITRAVLPCPVPPDRRVALEGGPLRPDVRGGGADVQPAVQCAQPADPVRSVRLHLRHQERRGPGPRARQGDRQEAHVTRRNKIQCCCDHRLRLNGRGSH